LKIQQKLKPFSAVLTCDEFVSVVFVFCQAIGAGMQDIKVSDHAEEHEELKTTHTKWGGARTGFQM
jgi:hypothetical protein